MLTVKTSEPLRHDQIEHIGRLMFKAPTFEIYSLKNTNYYARANLTDFEGRTGHTNAATNHSREFLVMHQYINFIDPRSSQTTLLTKGKAK